MPSCLAPKLLIIVYLSRSSLAVTFDGPLRRKGLIFQFTTIYIQFLTEHDVPPEWRHTCSVGQSIVGSAPGWSGPSRVNNNEASYRGNCSRIHEQTKFRQLPCGTQHCVPHSVGSICLRCFRILMVTSAQSVGQLSSTYIFIPNIGHKKSARRRR